MGTGNAQLVQLAAVTFLNGNTGSAGGRQNVAQILCSLCNQDLVQLATGLQCLPYGIAALDQTGITGSVLTVQLLHGCKGRIGALGAIIPIGTIFGVVFMVVTGLFHNTPPFIKINFRIIL